MEWVSISANNAIKIGMVLIPAARYGMVSWYRPGGFSDWFYGNIYK